MRERKEWKEGRKMRGDGMVANIHLTDDMRMRMTGGRRGHMRRRGGGIGVLYRLMTEQSAQWPETE